MHCNLHVYQINSDFSIEYAEAHHNGEESENNPKYEWEDEIVINNVISVQELPSAEYCLKGSMGDKNFSYNIQNMYLFRIKTKTNTIDIGCSKSILHTHSLKQTKDGYNIKLFLKDYAPMTNPIPGIYIDVQDFPKELIID